MLSAISYLASYQLSAHSRQLSAGYCCNKTFRLIADSLYCIRKTRLFIYNLMKSHGNSLILKRTEARIRRLLGKNAAGHDWWHIHRVRGTALAIARREGADLFIVELAALLHDIADWKFHKGDLNVGPMAAEAWLKKNRVKAEITQKVCQIIAEISFKGAGVRTAMSTREGRVVQDADRLDALGAIGIARAFAYGGAKGRVMYDPSIKPMLHKSFQAYKKARGTTVNHFYEKLLLLKDRMNTKTGRALARKRHAYMKNFLKTFYREWKP